MNKSKPGWNYRNLVWITLVHIVALASVFYFTWTNLALLLIGVFVLAPLAINVGYHRLLTHRGFVVPRWLRRGLATLGAFIGAGPPIHWAAMHRVHHRYSDTKKDPHDSTRGFWYSHFLHFFRLDEEETEGDHLERYAPDLVADPYLSLLNKYWIYVGLSSLPILYVFGGTGAVLWGGFFRLVASWHIMWFVNSASHMWGYRNYDTRDRSTNCWWVGLLAAGEGWHNNHHAYPSCAKHGHKWWELDFSFMVIRALELFGLARSVKRHESAGAELFPLQEANQEG